MVQYAEWLTPSWSTIASNSTSGSRVAANRAAAAAHKNTSKHSKPPRRRRDELPLFEKSYNRLKNESNSVLTTNRLGELERRTETKGQHL